MNDERARRDPELPAGGGAATAPERLEEHAPQALEERVRALREELQRREVEVGALEFEVERQRILLGNIQRSLGWKVVMRLRGARDVLGKAGVRRLGPGRATALLDRLLRRSLPPPPSTGAAAAAYACWVERHTPSAEALQAMRAEGARLARRPLFSVVVTTAGASEGELTRCLGSIRAPAWDRWEVVIAAEELAPCPLERALSAAAAAPGVRLVRAPEPGQAAAALAASRGDLVAFVPATDALAPEALFELARALEAAPDADLLYGDEDVLGERGERSAPFFKPDWSPDLLLSMDYLGQAAVFSRRLLDLVGGPRAEAGAAQRYDLALRAAEQARRVVHVPAVLHHARRSSRLDLAPPGPGEREAARRALEEALRRRGLTARVEAGDRPALRVRRAVEGAPLVSIVMPTRDKVDVLRACVESVDARSTWGPRELLVVDNGSSDRAALRYLGELERRHRVLRDRRAFNWSGLNNAAARQARGAYLLFMNNDMEVVAPDWIEALLEQAQRPEVGAVGAKLLYPDRTIQHAGVVLGLGVAGHAFKHLPDGEASYAGLAHAIRDVSAVTGACMMVRRAVFERLGGFDERLPVAFNDVDFCLRLRAEGLLVVYTPCAELIHHESATRGALHPPEDEALMSGRWFTALARDPYYSPHLTREREDYSIAR